MRYLFPVVLLLSCATTSAQLEREASTCDSFAEFDQKTREKLETLLTEAPGDKLVREASRLNTARRSCARHAIGGMLALREERGVEAVQRELNALTATYRPDDLRALMTASLGGDLAPLEPLLVEARTRVTRQANTKSAERRDDAEREKLKVDVPETMGAAPLIPESMCDEHGPCEQLRCVVEHPPASPERAARRCLDDATGLDPSARAKRASEVLALLPSGPSAARTEARMMLETLRTQLWPQVDAAIAAKQLGRAAQVASLFRTLPAVSAQVDKLRDDAQAHHLARAKAQAATPEAVWLHRRLAEEFGGPEAPALEGTGRWEKPRWRCKAEVPTLPELPAGLGGILTLRCDSPPPVAEKKGGEMRTFEMESSLRGQRLEGSLRITCADRSSEYALTIADPGVEGFPEQAFQQSIEQTIARAVTDCARIHEFAAPRGCAELRKKTAGELIARFVDHARFLHRWEPCFEEWLIATEGAAPPSAP